MKARRRFDRTASAYTREAKLPEATGNTFLIVTEGEKTEPCYFEALRKRLGLSSAEVVVLHPEGTDPITLTKEAVALRETRRQEAQTGFQAAYDEVWVVFDLEKTHDPRRKLAKQAMALKEAEGIKFAESDPSFEFWLLLHEEFTTAPLADSGAVVRRLKKHWKSYSKGQTPSAEFLEKLPIAIGNAERCRKHHRDAGGDRNPSTDVDLLAANLNAATRPNLRIPRG
jgi:hypothetical protein